MDLKIISLKNTNEHSNIDELVEQITQLETDINLHQETIEMIQEAATLAISTTPEEEEKILNIYTPRIRHFQELIIKKVFNNIMNNTNHSIKFTGIIEIFVLWK